MSDLSVRQADLDSARVRLQAAAMSTADACLATDVVGSDAVARALGEIDVLVSAARDALSAAAHTAAGDVQTISDTLDEADQSLAAGAGG